MLCTLEGYSSVGLECHGLSGRMIHLHAHHRHTRISSLLPQFSAAWLQLLLVHVSPHLPGRVAVGFRGCGTSTVPRDCNNKLPSTFRSHCPSISPSLPV